MMTKEEVAAIVTYCEENGVSYKDRLKELGCLHGNSLIPRGSTHKSRIKESFSNCNQAEYFCPIPSSLAGVPGHLMKGNPTAAVF